MTDVVRDRKVARSLDGMISAHPETGRFYRVCEPKWWQIRRWISRWLAKEKGAIGVTRDGRVYKVYVVGHKLPRRR